MVHQQMALVLVVDNLVVAGNGNLVVAGNWVVAGHWVVVGNLVVAGNWAVAGNLVVVGKLVAQPVCNHLRVPPCWACSALG